MTGDVSLDISLNEQNDFLITPNQELNSNSLYTFVLTVPNNDPVSWTFQTRRDFSILGVLPADQSVMYP